MVGEHCPHCHRPLIEIDYYGERLLGCIEGKGGDNPWVDGRSEQRP
jgi:hypothetical protein